MLGKSMVKGTFSGYENVPFFGPVCRCQEGLIMLCENNNLFCVGSGSFTEASSLFYLRLL